MSVYGFGFKGAIGDLKKSLFVQINHGRYVENDKNETKHWAKVY